MVTLGSNRGRQASSSGIKNNKSKDSQRYLRFVFVTSCFSQLPSGTNAAHSTLLLSALVSFFLLRLCHREQHCHLGSVHLCHLFPSSVSCKHHVWRPCTAFTPSPCGARRPLSSTLILYCIEECWRHERRADSGRWKKDGWM